MESLHVTHSGPVSFVATDRNLQPLEVTLICASGLPAGTDIRLCTSSFHTYTPEWRLDDVRLQGGGRIVLGHDLPRDWHEKALGGVGPAGGALIGRPVGEVYLCTVQVRQDLAPGARVVFALRVNGSPFAAVAGALRVNVRAPESTDFVQVGDDIPLPNGPGQPVRLEARATSDPTGRARVVVYATDRLLNPVPAYRASLQLLAAHGSVGTPDAPAAERASPVLPPLTVGADGRAVASTLELRGDGHAVISNGACVWLEAFSALDVALNAVELPAPAGPWAYYYLRLRQADGHRAWLSPVWLDRAI